MAKRLIGTVTILLTTLLLQAQDFFRNDFDKEIDYVLLANPTAVNIETVRFLTEKKLLKLNPNKTHFVGIYHKDQKYNFSEAQEYIRKEELLNFHLHEIRSPLNVNNLFGQNNLTDELKYIFN